MHATCKLIQYSRDFWQYFEPIRLNMPKNCSADVQLVVQYVDKVVASGNGTAISQIAEYFGLSNASSVEDLLGFSAFLWFYHIDSPSSHDSVGFPIWEWQKLVASSSKNSLFYQFCDALEISGGHIATEAGWGLENALLGWATFMRQLDDPPPDDPDSRHTDISWMWMMYVQLRNQLYRPTNLIGFLHLDVTNLGGFNVGRLTSPNLRSASDNSPCKILKSVPNKFNLPVTRLSPVFRTTVAKCFQVPSRPTT